MGSMPNKRVGCLPVRDESDFVRSRTIPSTEGFGYAGSIGAYHVEKKVACYGNRAKSLLFSTTSLRVALFSCQVVCRGRRMRSPE
jgi:hypothetical protein